MLKNELITTDKISNIIDKLILSDSLKIVDYGDDFYFHLTSFLRFYLAIPDQTHERFRFDHETYVGLEQFILENSDILEEEEECEHVDWNVVDDARNILKAKLKMLLGQEATSSYLRPFIQSTLHFFQNWLIYNVLYPKSIFNPWIPTLGILRKGYIYFVSDDRDVLTEYQKNIYERGESDIDGNLGLVTKSHKEKVFSGFVVDNRHDTQLLVHDYLKEYGSGVENAINLKDIHSFLMSKGNNLDQNEMRTKILLPLKRAGLIGSYPNGFFYISNLNDLKRSYASHLEKLKGIEKTLAIYEKKAHSFGVKHLRRAL